MGKLSHPSQGQELESVGRIPDQTENSISSKKCEKSVLCDGDIYYCRSSVLPLGSQPLTLEIAIVLEAKIDGLEISNVISMTGN